MGSGHNGYAQMYPLPYFMRKHTRILFELEQKLFDLAYISVLI